MSGSRLRLALGALAVMITLSGTAAAEPTAAEKETARTLLLSGREKRKNGQNKEALADFEKAHAIMHVPTTGLDLGKAQEALGMLVEARQNYLEAARFPKQANESPAYQKARDEAKKLADVIQPKLATLTVTVRTDAKLKIDDAEISASSIGAPLKVNPGRHQIVASLGTDEKRTSLDLAEGETKAIAFELTGPAPAPPTPPAPPPKTTHTESKINTLTWVGGGIAAVGIAVGAVTGVLAFTKKSSIESNCVGGTQCGRAQWSEIDSGYLIGDVSTGAFILAGVGAGIMIYGLLNPTKVETTALVKPRILPTPFGVSGSF